MNGTKCRMNWTVLLLCFVGYITCQNVTSTNHGNKFFFDWIYNLINPTTAAPTAPTAPTVPTVTPVVQSKCSDCLCGITKEGNRIVGGHETEKDAYRWMVSLLREGESICGASLISDLYVLTAAHCTIDIPTNEMTLYLGLHNLNEDHITRNVLYALKHEKFDSETLDHDIALLKMDERVKLYSRTGDKNSNLIPICLPKSERSYVGTEGVVTGWGRTSEGGSTSDVLMQVTLPIVTHKECLHVFKRQNLTITSTMFCAGFKEGGQDACQGDSGGPMQRINETDSTSILIGVVSWGIGCARKHQYGVFTNVTRLTSWVYDNTPDACFCS